jgi:hypothetical protein
VNHQSGSNALSRAKSCLGKGFDGVFAGWVLWTGDLLLCDCVSALESKTSRRHSARLAAD